jgi:hypothetical protein
MTTRCLLLDSTLAQAATTNDFTILFQSPIDLENTRWQVALSHITTYNSWYNISAANRNNIFHYNNGSTNRSLTLEDGSYNFQDLVTHIQDLMVTLGDYTAGTPNTFSINFSLDSTDGYVTLTLTNSYTVDFTGLKIAIIFGADNTLYSSSTIFPNQADIRNGVDQVFVHLDIISGNSYINGIPSDVIYSFANMTLENGIIQIGPAVYKYIGIARSGAIPSMRLYLTDQNNRPLDLNGAPLSVEFVMAMVR